MLPSLTERVTFRLQHPADLQSGRQVRQVAASDCLAQPGSQRQPHPHRPEDKGELGSPRLAYTVSKILRRAGARSALRGAPRSACPKAPELIHSGSGTVEPESCRTPSSRYWPVLRHPCRRCINSALRRKTSHTVESLLASSSPSVPPVHKQRSQTKNVCSLLIWPVGCKPFLNCIRF